MTRFFLLLLLLPVSTFAQSPDSCQLRLSGHLLDEHDDSPLDLATFYLVEAGVGTTSDSLGAFEIPDLCPGWHTIQYSHIGCEPGEVKIFLQKDTTILLLLEHHVKWLQSVTVRARRMEAAPVQNKTDLSGWELDQLRGASLAQSIASVAGVRMLQTGPGVAKPVIHGLHGTRIAIYNNGIRQEGQEWGVDHAPEIDPFTADRIRVIKGAAALQYGIGAIGGVVLSEPDPLPESPGLKGEAMLIGQNNGKQGTLATKWQGGWKKLDGFGWRLQGSLHRGGDWKAPRYELTNTGSAQGAASIGLGYQKGRISASAYYSFFQSEWAVLRSAHIGNVADFLEAIHRDTPLYVLPFSYTINAPRQWTQHHLVKAEAVFRPEKAGIWTLVYGFQQNARQEFDIRRAGRTAKPALDMDLGTHEGTLTWKPLHDGSTWHTTVGISFQYQQNRNVAGTGVRPLIPWFNSTTAGIFGIARYAKPLWEIETGIRMDARQLLIKRFDSQDHLLTEKLPFQGLSASIGASLHPNHIWTANVQAGTTFRPPHVSELYSEGLHHAVASIEQGDPTLQSEKALKGVAGLEFHPHKRLNIQLEGYYTYIRDFIYLEPGPEPLLTIRGVFPVFQYTQTDALLWGVDADAHWEMWRRFSLDLRASLLRSRDIRQDTYLLFMPADRAEASLRYALQTNKKVSDAHLSAGLVRTGRQTRAPEGIDLLPPPEGYTLLQASASCRLLLGKQAVSFFLNATNLLNTSYRDYLNRLRYYADEPGRNIELRVKLDF
ncbi:MAG: TonB-dependent receptor [Saprospirales bacterium]|nr:TonB-dependent receptor [Saprospirales bacterium]